MEPNQHQKGLEIKWNNISVTVPSRSDGKESKTILHNVSGVASPGRLMAIMGSSGAGKSTLLDVLAANTTSTSASSLTVTGHVLVDGLPRRSRAFRQQSCYVQQRDVLMAAATVKEAIATSAALRLPSSLTKAERAARVADVLRELDLESCADTLIGDENIGMKGISGGQKRRVSLGIELIKDPAIIFLDEPTSGLDSEMALGVVTALVNLARKDRTVVCTIHQPNSDITALFDDLMLLAKGRVAYSGLWTGALDAFASAGFECPLYKNPTDYFMWVLHNSESADLMCNAFEASEAGQGGEKGDAQLPALTQAAAEGSPSQPGCEDGSSHQPSLHVALEIADGTTSQGGVAPATAVEKEGEGKLARYYTSMTSLGATDSSGAQSVSWGTQVSVLTARTARNWMRNPNLLMSELVQYVFIALFCGLMYFDSFTSDLSDGVSNRMSCIWFAFAIMSFTPAFTTVTAWDKDRLLLKRELSQNQYSLTAFFTARTLCLIPLQALQCLLFVAISYFFSGFQRDAGKFFLFFAVLLMFQLVSEGLGLVCAIITRTATYAIILLTFVLLLILSFTGFLVTKIPVYFRWVNKASYLTYAFTALTMSELDGLTFTTPDPYNPSQHLYVPGKDAIPDSIDNGLSIGENIAILAGMYVFMEFGKLMSLIVSYKAGLM